MRASRVSQHFAHLNHAIKFFVYASDFGVIKDSIESLLTRLGVTNDITVILVFSSVATEMIPLILLRATFSREILDGYVSLDLTPNGALGSKQSLIISLFRSLHNCMEFVPKSCVSLSSNHLKHRETCVGTSSPSSPVTSSEWPLL